MHWEDPKVAAEMADEKRRNAAQAKAFNRLHAGQERGRLERAAQQGGEAAEAALAEWLGGPEGVALAAWEAEEAAKGAAAEKRTADRKADLRARCEAGVTNAEEASALLHSVQADLHGDFDARPLLRAVVGRMLVVHPCPPGAVLTAAGEAAAIWLQFDEN
jgi:hypothetical protein